MKSAPSDQKLRGGYYTPPPIAQFLARWAIRSGRDRVLEPSCGDGAFVEASARALLELGASPASMAELIVGVETDADEAAKATARMASITALPSPVRVHVGDFFAYCEAHFIEHPLLGASLRPRRAFDAVVGNPPFVRYQNFPEQYRRIAFRFMQAAGLRP